VHRTDCSTTTDGPPLQTQLVILGLASAFSPVALAVVMVSLSAPSPARLMLAYLAGGLVTSMTLGILLMGALQRLGVADRHGRRHLSPQLDIAVGAIGILIAGILLYRDRRPRAARSRDGKGRLAGLLDRATPRAMFLLGLLMGFPGVYYLAALKEIDTGEAQWTLRVAFLALVNIFAFVLIWVPLVAHVVAPERTRTLVTRVNEWILAHGRTIIVVVVAAAGAYEIARGVMHL
jgi:hypothetical protein